MFWISISQTNESFFHHTDLIGPADEDVPEPALEPQPIDFDFPDELDDEVRLESVGENDGEIHYAGGLIRYYKKYSRFEATCQRESHKPCRLTREAHGSDVFGAQGRPLGLLASWLEFSDCEDIISHEEHNDPMTFGLLDFERRLEARRNLTAIPGSFVLF